MIKSVKIMQYDYHIFAQTSNYVHSKLDVVMIN